MPQISRTKALLIDAIRTQDIPIFFGREELTLPQGIQTAYSKLSRQVGVFFFNINFHGLFNTKATLIEE